jgi:hypothetical protein
MAPASSAISADLLSRVCAELDARMVQLRPGVDEYGELLAAVEELDREVAPTPRRRGPRGSAAGVLELAASGASKRATGSTKRAASGPSKPDASGPSKPAASRSRKRATSGSSKRSAPGSSKRAATGRSRQGTGSKAPRSAAEQAIVAALEHGSHTVGELVLVTAMAGAQIRAGAQRLQRAGAITRTKREGRAAYALSGAAED